MTLSNTTSYVKVGTDLSEPFDTVRGFRQGGPLACGIFQITKFTILFERSHYDSVQEEVKSLNIFIDKTSH